MNADIVAEAAGLFAITNVDDIVVLSLFFGRSAGQPGAARRIVAGQYLGFTAILAITVAAAYGATFLPKSAIASVIGRWGHILHPLVLIALGLFLLIQGGAFGL